MPLSRPARPAPEPAAGPPSTPPARRALFPRRAALILALLLLLAAALLLPGAWRQTARQEAFLPALEAQAARTPDDGPLLALVGARRLQAGENAGAADALRQAIADGEGSGEGGEIVWRALAAAVAASGDRVRAIADLRLGVQALPAAPALQGALAEARITDPQAPPAALALAIEPRGPGPLLAEYGAGSFLSPLARRLGEFRPETSGFMSRQERAAARPRDAQAQRLWGEALLQNRRLPEAEGALAQALALAPDSPAAHLALARLLMQTGRAPKAALEYLRCLTLRPGWPPALLGFGDASLASGLTANAAQAFAQATRLAPQNADAWIGLGRARMKNGVTYDDALRAFATAARLAPARTDFFNDYADALRHRSRSADAEGLIRRRLVAAPGDALAHYLLGLLLRNTAPTPARLAEAERETRESLRLSPHNPLPETQLGELLLDAGRTAEALPLLEDARTRTPANQPLLLLLARACRQAGRTAEAARYAADAKTLFAAQQQAAVLADQSHHHPLDVALHRRLAALYLATGQPAKAQTEADTARLLETDPAGTARQKSEFDAQVQRALGG